MKHPIAVRGARAQRGATTAEYVAVVASCSIVAWKLTPMLLAAVQESLRRYSWALTLPF